MPLNENDNDQAQGLTESQQARLREPFPPEAIGKLPRGNVKLDYVGHAAVTDRLLEVDRHWYWEPLAFDPNGAPLIVERNGMLEMWVKLTIGGTTRLGVGTVQAKKAEAAKELIGDALRNAAMRFGVAIDLWSKEDLQAFNEARDYGPLDAPEYDKPKPKPQRKVEVGEVPPLDDGPFALMQALTDLEAEMVSAGLWPKGFVEAAAAKRETTLDDLATSPVQLHEFVTAAFEAARKKVAA